MANQVLLRGGFSRRRDEDFSYVAYGHSLLADPWGNVVAEAGSGQEIVRGTVDTDYIAQVRRELPLLSARRTDVYELKQR